MKIILDEKGTNILLNDDEIEIFKELLRNTSSYLDEYGYQVDTDFSVDKMIDELWEGFKNERIN